MAEVKYKPILTHKKYLGTTTHIRHLDKIFAILSKAGLTYFKTLCAVDGSKWPQDT